MPDIRLVKKNGTEHDPKRPSDFSCHTTPESTKALHACLTSIDSQSLERGLFEVIVVDNGSSPIPEDIVAKHCGTRLLQELQPGPGPARNFGVRSAIGDIIAFIDADCRAHRDWLRNALQTIRSSPEGTIAGGDVRIWRSRRDTFTALEAYEEVFSYRFKWFIEHLGFCGTGNLVVRHADYEKAGSFAGIEFAEDVEWGQRARSVGLDVPIRSEYGCFPSGAPFTS